MRAMIQEIADNLLAFAAAKAAQTATPLDDMGVKVLKSLEPWLVNLLADYLESLFGAGNVPPELIGLANKVRQS